MNVSIEVLKNKQNKYIFCRIEVQTRPVFYFQRQKKPHRTHRWISTEQWRAYDCKLQELFSKNELDYLDYALTYKLEGSMCLQIKNSEISKTALYETLNNKNIQADDIVNVIDCKIMHQDFSADDFSSTQNTCEVIEETPTIEETSSTSQKKPKTTQKVFENDEDMLLSCSENSLLKSPSTKLHLKQSPVLPSSSKTEQTVVIKIDSSDELGTDQLSPVFPYNNESLSSAKSCDKQINETSTESSDFFEHLHTTKKKNNEKTSVVDGRSQETTVDQKDTSKKHHVLKDINENDKDDSDVQTSPSIEKRKRKLCFSHDQNSENFADKMVDSPKQKCAKTDKHKHNDEVDRKSSEKGSARTKISSSSSAKKKKNQRERSKSPKHNREKESMSKWLCKSSSKDDGKPHKSNKHSTNKQNGASSTGQKDLNLLSLKTQLTTVERSLSNEEKIELTRQNQIIVENDRQLIKNIKKMLPKEPKRVTMLNLTDMTDEEILATYEEHRQELKSIFRSQKSQKNFSSIDGVDHFLVMDLVANRVQQKLMEKLSEFEKDSGSAPRYGNLFSMVLMPEWILRVFMSKYEMSRDEAIEHLKAQNQFKAMKTFHCKELDEISFKKK